MLPCKSLIMLTSGSVEVETRAADNTFRIIETIEAPLQIEPERLFGMTQRYRSTYKSATECNAVTISKTEFLKLSQYDTFRINILNILSKRVQDERENHLTPYPTTLRHRIIRLLASRCVKPTGVKIFNIKMAALAEELNDSRRDISAALNAMQQEGIISLHRGGFTTTDLVEISNRYLAEASSMSPSI